MAAKFLALKAPSRALAVSQPKPLAMKQAKVIELAPNKARSVQKKIAKSGGGGPIVGGGSGRTSPADEIEGSTSEEADSKPKGVVKSQTVVSLLVSAGYSQSDAEAIVMSAQLSQNNPRVPQTGAAVNRRDGGAGFGRGSSGGGSSAKRGKKRAAAQDEPAPARATKQSARSPGGGGKPLQLENRKKPLALPSSPSRPLALPSSSGKMGIAQLPSGSSAPLALPSSAPKSETKPKKSSLVDAAKGALKAKGEELAKSASESTTGGALAADLIAKSKQNLNDVKAAWKAGNYEYAIRLAADSPVSPVKPLAVGTNTTISAVDWLRKQLSK